MQVLTRRADFLRAASAQRQGSPGFLLQARQRGEGEQPDLIRVGFTCSKKLGNAVTRNRAKRRLRVVARTVLPVAGKPGWDYVLVGRPRETVARDFAALLADCETALARIHRGPENGRPEKAGKGSGAEMAGHARHKDPAASPPGNVDAAAPGIDDRRTDRAGRSHDHPPLPVGDADRQPASVPTAPPDAPRQVVCNDPDPRA